MSMDSRIGRMNVYDLGYKFSMNCVDLSMWAVRVFSEKILDLNFATFQICFPSVKTEEKKIIVHLVDMRRNAFSASMVKYFFFLAFLQPEYVSFCLIRY